MLSTHEWPQDGGTYTVTLRVENDNGAVGIVTNTVTTCAP